MASATHRLFLGIKPKAPLLSRLLEEQTKLAERLPAFRKVAPEGIHLTLHFLGEINDVLLEGLLETLPEVKFSAGEQPLEQWTTFPKREATTTVGLGNAVVSPALLPLYVGLNDAVTTAGLRLEERAYFPHFTLLRIRRPVVLEAEQLPAITPLTFSWESFGLYESRLEPTGPVHTLLREFPAK